MASGTSQEALGVLMGIDRSHVSGMERGKKNVTLTTLWQAATALGIEPSALLDKGVIAIAGTLTGKVQRKRWTLPRG